MIKALIWKKYIELKNIKLKLLVFLIIAPACFIGLCFLEIPHEQVVFYFAVVLQPLVLMSHWNLEDFAYSGIALITPLSPKRSWIVNSLIMSINGYLYSFITLLIGSSVYRLITGHEYVNPIYFLYSLFTFSTVVALTISATLHFVDNSLAKQWIQVPFSLFGISLIFLLIFAPYILPIGLVGIVINIITSFAIIGFCLLLNHNIKNEVVFINSEKILKVNMINE